jgi:DMSO/TMAO reductase YedYZ molybdopterin-dependent catalytic subunit
MLGGEMDRRRFISATGTILLASAHKLSAGHHVVSAEPLIVESELSALDGRYTRLEDFYIRNHFQAPQATAVGSVAIEGAVERPGAFRPHNFAKIPPCEVEAVLECAGGPLSATTLASDGIWRGWPLGEIIALAAPQPQATHIHFFGRDGFSRSVPIERAMKDGLLVTSLNGRPLGRNHGAPWRLLFPGWYGMDSVKWLERVVVANAALPSVDGAYLQFTKQPGGGFEARPLPRIQIKSIITAPADGAVLQRGMVEVHGLAWSGFDKVLNIEVSADDGVSWRRATVDNGGSRYDWTLWRISFSLDTPGVIRLVSKATDDSGNTQPATRDPRRADRYANNVYHCVRCIVV